MASGQQAAVAISCSELATVTDLNMALNVFAGMITLEIKIAIY